MRLTIKILALAYAFASFTACTKKSDPTPAPLTGMATRDGKSYQFRGGEVQSSSTYARDITNGEGDGSAYIDLILKTVPASSGGRIALNNETYVIFYDGAAEHRYATVGDSITVSPNQPNRFKYEFSGLQESATYGITPKPLSGYILDLD